MPPESLAARSARTKRILVSLEAAYPNAECALEHRTPLQLLIATILSAQCTDKQVNLVTPELFRKYTTAADFADADIPELERAIQRIGFFRMKAKNIKACGKALVEHHGGEVPRTMEELTALAGVGRKTANVVLGNAFDINVGVVVDTHVARLSQRLCLTRHAQPEKIEQDLMKIVPRDDWTEFSHLLIWHGRSRCYARKPDCPHCEVLDLCPTGLRNVGAMARGQGEPASAKGSAPKARKD